MKYLFLLILLISCNNEEYMRASTSISSGEFKKTYYGMMTDQSIMQGQLPVRDSGLDPALLNNPNLFWLDAKLATPIYKPSSQEMMSPYQYGDYATAQFGCGPEYQLGDLFKNDKRILYLYKPAYGGQLYGTDSNPEKFHINSSATQRGEVTEDTYNILQARKTAGDPLDFVLMGLGYSDGRFLQSTRDAFEVNQRRHIADIRIVYPNVPVFVLFLVPEQKNWMDAVIPGGYDAINLAKQNIVDDLSLTKVFPLVIPGPVGMLDLIHFNTVGQGQLALAIYNALKSNGVIR